MLLAKMAVKHNPKSEIGWFALGQSHYRRGEYKDAVAPLETAMKLSDKVCGTLFYRAMTHWQLGAKEEAIHVYQAGVERMEKLKRDESTLLAVRTEAAALLEISDEKSKAPKMK